MTRGSLVASSRRFYARRSAYLGIAAFLVSALVCADLLVGYSVRLSIERHNLARIGRTTHLAVSGGTFGRDLSERVMRAARVKDGTETIAASWLEIPLVSVTSGSRVVSGIAGIGIDGDFLSFFPDDGVGSDRGPGPAPGPGELWLNRHTADLLGCEQGSRVSLRVPSLSAGSGGSAGSAIEPVARGKASFADTVYTVTRVLPNRRLGRFTTNVAQSAPRFVMVRAGELADLAGIPGRANRMLVASGEPSWAIPKGALSLGDAGLTVTGLGDSAAVTCDSFFLSREAVEALRAIDPEGRAGYAAFLTGASWLGGDGRKAEYPFLFAVSSEGEERTRASTFLAREIGVSSGDAISLSFYRYSPDDGSLLEESVSVTVDSIDADAGFIARRGEIPEFPGLDGRADCRDWKSGLPLDLSRVTAALEDDWKRNGKRPLLSLDSETARRISPDPVRFTFSEAARADGIEALGNRVAGSVTAELAGIRVEPIRAGLMAASRGSVDFTGLFLAMGFFLFAALAFLHAVLVRQFLEPRRGEVGTLCALGFSPRAIRTAFVRELAPILVLSAAAGSVAGVPLVGLYLAGLRGVWYGAVNTDALDLFIAPWAIPVAFASGALPAIALTARIVGVWLKGSAASQMAMPIPGVARRVRRVALVASVALLASSVIAFALSSRWASAESALGFLSGSFLVLGLISLWRALAKRESQRNFAFLAVAALSVFLVAAVSANRRVMLFDPVDSRSPTGGRAFVVRTALGIPEGEYPRADVVPFALHGRDSANCLNLNALDRPALLGFDAATMDAGGIFSLADGKGAPVDWKSLCSPLPDGSIPVAVDRSVLEWSLKRNLGDRIRYPDAKGGYVDVTLCALANDTVLQGYLYIDRGLLFRTFGSGAESTVFLAGMGGETDGARRAVDRAFSAWGGEVTGTGEALAEFMELENTYLRIFECLSAVALALGFFGVGLLARAGRRDGLERESLLRALGFSPQYARRGLFARYSSRFALACAFSAVALAPALCPSIAGQGGLAGLAGLGVALRFYGAIAVSGIALLAVSLLTPSSRSSPMSGRT